jgi:hypothetical protein
VVRIIIEEGRITVVISVPILSMGTTDIDTIVPNHHGLKFTLLFTYILNRKYLYIIFSFITAQTYSNIDCIFNINTLL